MTDPPDNKLDEILNDVYRRDLGILAIPIAKTAIQKLITEARIDENYRLASTISNEKSTYSKHIMIAMTDDRIETLQQSLQKEG